MYVWILHHPLTGIMMIIYQSINSVFNLLSTKESVLNKYKLAEMESLRKHIYSNILKILQPKTGKFSDKKFKYFSYFCSKHRLWYSLELPRRGGSNKYPQSMF